MMRALYYCMVRLHPPVFRREFALEMLWIYDQAAPSQNVGPLFLDGAVSLVRQWLLRSGYWKIFAALAGALLQVAFGGGVVLFFNSPPGAGVPVNENPELADLIHLIAVISVGLLAAVMFLVIWWRKLSRRMGA